MVWAVRLMIGCCGLLMVAIVGSAPVLAGAESGRAVVIDDRADLLSPAVEARIWSRLGRMAGAAPPILVRTLPDLAASGHWFSRAVRMDDRIVLLVAWRERRILLHGPASGAAYHEIVRRVIVPAFATQAYDRGVEDGLEAAVRLAGGGSLAFLPSGVAPPAPANETLRRLTAPQALARALLPGWLGPFSPARPGTEPGSGAG